MKLTKALFPLLAFVCLVPTSHAIAARSLPSQDSSLQAQSSLPAPPDRYRYTLLYKGADFTFTVGVNQPFDNFSHRNAVYANTHRRAIQPVAGLVAGMQVEVPLNARLRAGFGAFYTEFNRRFTPTAGLISGPETESINRQWKLQMPIYVAFDYSVGRISLGVAAGGSLSFYQSASGTAFTEELVAFEYGPNRPEDYFRDYALFNFYTEARFDYRFRSNIGLVARLGFHLPNGNELQPFQGNGELRTGALQLRLGMNYTLYCR